MENVKENTEEDVETSAVEERGKENTEDNNDTATETVGVEESEKEGKCGEIVETEETENNFVLCEENENKSTSMDEMDFGFRTDEKEAELQFEAFQTSEIAEKEAEDQDDDESEESGFLPKERKRKITRAPIFKEIVKKVIAENLKKRMIQEASESGRMIQEANERGKMTQEAKILLGSEVFQT